MTYLILDRDLRSQAYREEQIGFSRRARVARARENRYDFLKSAHKFRLWVGDHPSEDVVTMIGFEANKQNSAFLRAFIGSKNKNAPLKTWRLAEKAWVKPTTLRQYRYTKLARDLRAEKSAQPAPTNPEARHPERAS